MRDANSYYLHSKVHCFNITNTFMYNNYKATVFTQINHIFPVRKHSYMPPDRVFGRIEQVLKKKETIL